MKLLVISGLSGSGKSIALEALEDRQYYCVDNLPVSLLPEFATQMVVLSEQRSITRIAVGIDARNITADLESFFSVLDAVKKQGVDCEVIFLEADDNVLLKRFSETRRRHPLTNSETPLLEAVIKERHMLAPILDQADLRIDTSLTNVHQLRDLVVQRIAGREKSKLSLQLMSFGFKKGVPADVDFVFDVRCLPNPYWDPRLRQYTGRDDEVIGFLTTQAEVIEMQADIVSFLKKWLPRFQSENRSYMTVAIGCTGGQHRSVFLADHVATQLGSDTVQVLTRHRELI